MRDVAVVAGYVVRCPLAGYGLQALHYLLGLRQLGFDVWFYEDTAHYPACFDPPSGTMGPVREPALRFAAALFAAHGLGERWLFHDAQRDRWHGNVDGRAALAETRLLVGLAAVNRLPRHVGRRRLFVDLDPGVTQIAAARDAQLAALLDEYDAHATIGERIGRPECAVPTGGRAWLPTRQPVVLELWPVAPLPRDAPFTTVGRWDEPGRSQELDGVRYGWSKRDEWLRLLDLPARSGGRFRPALDVDKQPGDAALLAAHGWQCVDPLAVSTDIAAYRAFIDASRGEFSTAKELNVRLATGWFSDRSACYLAAGRPVVVQDTGLAGTLPTGAGLLPFGDADQATGAVRAVLDDWPLHSAAARRIAEQHFAASRVLGDLLARVL